MTRLKSLLSALFIAASLLLTPQAFADEIIAEGTVWENVSQKTSGDWSIVERDDGFYLELEGNFSTRRAPDLKVFLSTESADTRNNRNGLENTVFISALTTNKGSQSYKLPGAIDPTEYSTLIIYCEAFSKFWAATSI